MAFIRRSTLGSVRGASTGANIGRLGASQGLGANIKVVGVPEAIRKLGLVGTTAARDTGLIVRTSAYQIRDRAQEIVHSPTNPWSGSDYDYTGNLKDGIQVAGSSGAFSQTVTASSKDGGSDREYAAFEEFGTYKTPAHPYMRPATSQQVPKTVAMLGVLARKLQRL